MLDSGVGECLQIFREGVEGFGGDELNIQAIRFPKRRSHMLRVLVQIHTLINSANSSGFARSEDTTSVLVTVTSLRPLRLTFVLRLDVGFSERATIALERHSRKIL